MQDDRELIEKYAKNGGKFEIDASLERRRERFSNRSPDGNYSNYGKEGDDPYRCENEEEMPDVTEKNCKDPCLSLLTGQLIICAAVLLCVFAVKFIGGDVYDTVRSGYINRFCRQTTAEEVTRTMASVFTKRTDGAGSSISAVSEVSQPEASLNSPPDSAVSQQKSEVSSEASADSTLTSSYAQSDASAAEIPQASRTLFSGSDSASAVQQSIGTGLSEKAAYTGMGDIITARLTEKTANRMLSPVNGEITSLFGLRLHPVFGEELFHSGVDIGADMGSEIYAALSGTVKTVAEDSRSGKYLVIAHSDTLSTLYAHCSEISVSEGESVEMGETVAKVGSTGVSTGPHLHFAVTSCGVYLNPLWFIG